MINSVVHPNQCVRENGKVASLTPHNDRFESLLIGNFGASDANRHIESHKRKSLIHPRLVRPCQTFAHLPD